MTDQVFSSSSDPGPLTKKRDLRTGTPVWAVYDSPKVAEIPLHAPIKVDVVVAGAGITGALVAEATTALGMSTLLLDRRGAAMGSTAASTALIQFEIDEPLVRLADAIGFDKAKRVWLRSFQAVENLGRLIKRLQIDCDYRERRVLYLAGNRMDKAALAEEARWRREIGLPSRFLSDTELWTYAKLERDAAVLSDGAAELNPTRLTRALLNRVAARGTILHAPVELVEIAPSRQKVAMATADGIEVEAKSLVLATGYELPKIVPTAGHRLTSTWAMATPPQPDRIWTEGALIWEASDPYLYIRSTADGRVVIGGEDEAITDADVRNSRISLKSTILQKKLQALMPWLDASVDFAWAGTFGEAEHGLPSIGAIPGYPNCYAVLGYGGNGFTFGAIAAEFIAQALIGRPDRDAELFAFSR